MAAKEDFSVRTIPRFLEAAFLVTNAVSDSILVFRGSACVYEAFLTVVPTHDQGQTVYRSSESRRLLDTTEPYTLSVLGGEDRAGLIGRWKGAMQGKSVVLLAELASITLMGENLRRTARIVTANTGLPCVPAVSRSLVRDDADAWRALLDGLMAAVLERDRPPLEDDAVGIVGYPFARNEGDAVGDVAELARLVEGLGLRPLPVWLSGCDLASLARVASARHVVAFPNGLPAANRLAAATGATVTATGLPVSLAQTERWVRDLGARTGTGDAADRLIDRELDRVVPLLDRVVRPAFLGRRAVVIAAADWLPGIVECLREDLGFDVACAIARSRRDPERPDADRQAADRTFDPSEATLHHHLARAVETGGVDVIIGSARERNGLAREHRGIPFLEFGFPQEEAHFLAPTPHLGFAGVLTWAQRLFDLRRTHGHS